MKMKTKNKTGGLPPHIEQTVAGLETEIAVLAEKTAALTNAKAALLAVYGIGVIAPYPPVQALWANAPAMDKPRRKYTRRAPHPDPLPKAEREKTAPPAAPAPVKLVPTVKPKVPAIIPAGEPQTFAGACKRVFREAGKPLTLAEANATVRAKYPQQCEGKGAEALGQNVYYWTSKGYMEKAGSGSLATYKIVNAEFFKEIEE